MPGFRDAYASKTQIAQSVHWFNCGGLTKFENTFFQIAKLKFLPSFDKIPKFSKKKFKGLMDSTPSYKYLVGPLNIFAKCILKVDFRGGGCLRPRVLNCYKNMLR